MKTIDTNLQRAFRAFEALKSEYGDVLASGDSLEDALSDLLCDLQHLCIHEKISFAEQLRRATCIHNEERMEESATFT